MRVVIIGGGFSGLAAGVALVEAGHEVLLLERRNQLGGRAYSLTDSKTGDVVDNGQHLFMGCYHSTIEFLKKIGRLERLAFQDAPHIEFLDLGGRLTQFHCPPLPPPFHAVAGILRLKGLSVGDRLRALKVGSAIQTDSGRKQIDSLTVERWLDALGQSEAIKERFWHPMVIATLNEDPRVASAKMMRTVLAESFGGRARDANIGMARVGLSDLYTGGAREFIESRGGRVRTDAQVASLIIKRDSVVAAELKGGERVEADCFISAVTHSAFLQILPEGLRGGEFAALARLKSSPIVSINLWFDRRITDRRFLGLLGTRIQWLFNKDLIVPVGKTSNQVAIIISAAHKYADWSKSALVEMAVGELHLLIPESQSARLLHSVVIKEREATLSHTVESDKLRPGARTSIRNLILAGDWTDTGLPATIESAVLSGNRAARCVDE